ncbi:rhodanese-like domain-containing protein [Elizabethkingia sp. JS20170427COW]|uniref:rhodanese-like domain-containing protein n=1 Tax=Elizabethkingia sp. JS20170427COW TaxID=2583851 RepID=UPI001110669F|nr:rhodanese-like domain-containing protein [Elizabethkingia sp. JS20170427COW]QCX52649.1 rhodanese-like domain-containing protein [Elizabethkingia sp. JS20170427COW]
MIEEVLKAGGYHLIDVREEMELEMDGAINGAVNIPLGEIAERKDEIMNLDGNIIFFCRSGNRSGKALEFFKNEGLTNIYNGGGYQDVAQALENVL